jgi:hypothetical protein
MRADRFLIIGCLVFILSIGSLGLYLAIDGAYLIKVMLFLLNAVFWLAYFKYSKILQGTGGRQRRRKQVFQHILNVCLFTLVVLAFNRLASFWNISWDLSIDGEHSLSSEIKSVLDTVQGPVTLKLFDQKQNWSQYRQILRRYSDYKSNIKLEFYDPQLHLKVTQENKVTRVPFLIIESDQMRTGLDKINIRSIDQAFYNIKHSKDFIICYDSNAPEALWSSMDLNGLGKISQELGTFKFNLIPILEAKRCDQVLIYQAGSASPSITKALIDRNVIKKQVPILVFSNFQQWNRTEHVWQEVLERTSIVFEENIVIDREAAQYKLNLNHIVLKNEQGIRVFPDVSTIKYRAEAVEVIEELKIKNFPLSWAEGDIAKLQGEALSVFDKGIDDQFSPFFYLHFRSKPLGGVNISVMGSSTVLQNQYLASNQNRDFLIKILVEKLDANRTFLLQKKFNTGQKDIYLNDLQIKTTFYLSVVLLPLFFFGLSFFVFRKYRLT